MADQLSNFLAKFRNEWQAGTDARLVIECHAGQAWITLHQPLGYSSPPPNHHPRQPGPSRLRRRARRAHARAAASVASTNPPSYPATAEMAVQAEIVHETSEVAVQADVNQHAPPPQVPAVQPGHPAEKAPLHPTGPHHVRDTLCHVKEYQLAAVQAGPSHHGVTHQIIFLS